MILEKVNDIISGVKSLFAKQRIILFFRRSSYDKAESVRRCSFLYFNGRALIVLDWQFWIHLALAILGTAYFLYSYLKEKKIYQLLFVIWIPLTLLTYVCKKQWQILILGGIQLVFFILVIYFLFRNPGKKSAMQSTLEQLDAFGAEATDASDAGDAAHAAAPDESEISNDVDGATEAADNNVADAEAADAQSEENPDSYKE